MLLEFVKSIDVIISNKAILETCAFYYEIKYLKFLNLWCNSVQFVTVL